MLSDLSHLDSDTVGLVTKFYCLVDRMNAFIVHFKSEEFVGSNARIHKNMKDILAHTVKEMHLVGEELEKKLKCA
jgi:hypothetical protein